MIYLTVENTEEWITNMDENGNKKMTNAILESMLFGKIKRYIWAESIYARMTKKKLKFNKALDIAADLGEMSLFTPETRIVATEYEGYANHIAIEVDYNREVQKEILRILLERGWKLRYVKFKKINKMKGFDAENYDEIMETLRAEMKAKKKDDKLKKKEARRILQWIKIRAERKHDKSLKYK